MSKKSKMCCGEIMEGDHSGLQSVDPFAREFYHSMLLHQALLEIQLSTTSQHYEI